MPIRSSLFAVLLLACGGAPAQRPDPGDPCPVALRMRDHALRQLSDAPACDVDDDCIVIRTEIDCANVHLGDCGTLVNRAAESSLDWARVEREICEAVEGTELGCAVYASCTALDTPRCENGTCTQRPIDPASSTDP